LLVGGLGGKVHHKTVSGKSNIRVRSWKTLTEQHTRFKDSVMTAIVWTYVKGIE